MAGSRGIAGFRGEQIRGKALRDSHFDSDFKIGEDKVDLQWTSHREILEDTKIDVRVQVNNVEVAGVSAINVVLGDLLPVGVERLEGVVLSEKVILRITGTDSPASDEDADLVYGRVEEVVEEDEHVGYTLTFYSIDEEGEEYQYNFGNDAPHIDYQYVVRTNLSVIPVDAIIKGGAGFVEGATDAKAYMNLIQLMKDLYGPTGTLDNDGNANLSTSITGQIGSIESDIADSANRGSSSVNGYFTEEEFLSLADRLSDIESVSDYLFKDIYDLIEGLAQGQGIQVEEVYEATGGETSYVLDYSARENSVLLFINGAAQAPGINFEYVMSGSEITGFSFAPETLKGELDNPTGVPDILLIKYVRELPS